ncbi:MAG TPA: phosphate acyltransferase PlsX [Gammaproteobacteria bacterium]|nr:phosphate acyltransferase PlsX [Gammaproteobacteria bacterium]
MITTIAVDAMGGDFGPPVTVPAVLHCLQHNLKLQIILVGRTPELHACWPARHELELQRVEFLHAEQVVEMNEAPAQAMRAKKDSSMRVAINLVQESRADACVSAGNTGALMATARYVLKTLPGIDRPAIISSLPAIKGHTHLLDLGANIDSSPEQLLQFAIMGSVLVKATEDIAAPTVGLLNIGVEDIKGSESIKAAARLIRNTSLNYQGFVEGDGIYHGVVDVVVCDGFIGNVALKTSEGLAQMIRRSLHQEFKRNWYTRLAGLVAMPALTAMKRRIDHRRHNGATLIGLRKTVIKSHGGADTLAFQYAINKAVAEVDRQVTDLIQNEIQQVLQETG